MFQISIPRIQRIALMLGAAGTVVALLAWGPAYAAGFAVGAAIAMTTISSWSRLANSLNPEAASKPSAKGAALFLVLRYALIGAAIFATIKVLGVTPVAMLLGLLVSFAAVLVELVQQSSKR